MGKKSSAISYLYLIGMALAVIGFCCPMFKLGPVETNGFKFINFDNSGFVTIGALLIIVGTIAGLAYAVLGLLKIKLPSPATIMLVALIVSIVGGVVLVLGFTTNGGIYKAIGKGFIKHASVGFYLVIAGWVVALVGKILNK